MAPFIAASGITFYLVSTMQEMGVRCGFIACYLYGIPASTELYDFGATAEAYATDPKNPYAAQIAKETRH